MELDREAKRRRKNASDEAEKPGAGRASNGAAKATRPKSKTNGLEEAPAQLDFGKLANAATPPPPTDEGAKGHRQRLRNRVLEAGAEALADYEVLEMLLFAGNPRGDTKPLAKRLLARFGSLGAVLAAEPASLRNVSGLGDAAIACLKVTQSAAVRMAQESLKDRPLLSSWQSVLDYCRIVCGHGDVEQLHLFFLDNKNRLIADEAQQRGTVNHTPVYPREVMKRALELGASALIIVHNHPSGDATPSRSDIDMTKGIVEAAASLSIRVHDHIIIGASDHFSFKSKGLL